MIASCDWESIVNCGLDVRKGDLLLTLLWSEKSDASTVEIRVEFPQKLEIKLLYNPVTSFMAIFPYLTQPGIGNILDVYDLMNG